MMPWVPGLYICDHCECTWHRTDDHDTECWICGREGRRRGSAPSQPGLSAQNTASRRWA